MQLNIPCLEPNDIDELVSVNQNFASLKAKLKRMTKSFTSINSITYWSVEDRRWHSIKFHEQYTNST